MLLSGNIVINFVRGYGIDAVTTEVNKDYFSGKSEMTSVEVANRSVAGIQFMLRFGQILILVSLGGLIVLDVCKDIKKYTFRRKK
jgi:hypothetical protein